MCWSEGASIAMVGVGVVATVVTVRRKDPVAIPATIAFFAVMEALQVAGYWYIDQCSLTANQTVTLLSYVHIAFQPIFINAFAMALVPVVISTAMRRWVYALSGLSTVLLLARLVPIPWAEPCAPGSTLCGPAYCVFSGDWHQAWDVPLNSLWGSFGWIFRDAFPFPDYLLAVFVLPLFYGAWRLVVFHALLGPILASVLTDNPNEMPAVWCLLSVGLALIGISPLVRRRVTAPAPTVAA